MGGGGEHPEQVAATRRRARAAPPRGSAAVRAGDEQGRDRARAPWPAAAARRTGPAPAGRPLAAATAPGSRCRAGAGRLSPPWASCVGEEQHGDHGGRDRGAEGEPGRARGPPPRGDGRRGRCRAGGAGPGRRRGRRTGRAARASAGRPPPAGAGTPRRARPRPAAHPEHHDPGGAVEVVAGQRLPRDPVGLPGQRGEVGDDGGGLLDVGVGRCAAAARSPGGCARRPSVTVIRVAAQHDVLAEPEAQRPRGVGQGRTVGGVARLEVGVRLGGGVRAAARRERSRAARAVASTPAAAAHHGTGTCRRLLPPYDTVACSPDRIAPPVFS